MKILNPTKDKLKIMYLGTWYEVEAEGELKNVPKEAAEYWKTMIHKFIIVVDETDEVMVREKVKEVIGEKEEEKEEEEKEEKVEKKTKKTLKAKK